MVGSSLARLGLKAAGQAAGAGGWGFADIAQRLSPAVSKFQVRAALARGHRCCPRCCRRCRCLQACALGRLAS